MRHAVTKMAHLHFPSTAHSAARVLQMGEEPWRVHAVGDPALDHFVRGECASAEELAAVFGFVPDRTTLLVTFHPVTLEEEDMPRQATELAAALAGYDGAVVLTAPAPIRAASRFAGSGNGWQRRGRKRCSWKAWAATVIAG